MPAPLHYALALFFLWLLAAAAAHKFLHHHYYAGLLRSALAAGGTTAGVLVRLIAVTEAVLALGLALSSLRQWAFPAAALLLAGYGLGMGLLLARGRGDLKCGCSGPASGLRISPALVARNTVLAVLALAGALPVAGAVTTPGQGANAVLIGMFLIAIYLCIEQLLRNAQRLRELRG